MKTNEKSPLDKTTLISRLVVALLWLAVGFWSWNWLGPIWVKALRPGPAQFIDFYQDWGSARNYWNGLPIYTPHSISVPRYLGLSSNPEPSIEYNVHPPTSVLLALPLGRLGYPAAALVWNMVSLSIFMISIAIVAVALSIPRSLFLPGLALLPFCVPVLGNLQMAQITMILCFCVTAIWGLERSGRSNWAALILGAAAAIKLFPAYLALYYLAQGRVRPLLTALVSFATLTFVTALVLGLDTYRDYVTVVLPWNAEFRIIGYSLSIAGLWHKLFFPTNAGERIIPLWHSLAIARWGTLLSNLTITATVAIFAYRARTRPERDLAFATIVTAMLLVSPVTWDISLLLLFLPIAIIGRSTGNLRSKWMPATLVLIVATVWVPQLLLTSLITGGRTIEVAPPSFLLGAASIKFYALLGTLVLGLLALRADVMNARGGATAGAAP
jgi:hypothetical protein